jgi:hypothetical protein
MGQQPDGSLLSPAFPYDHFTRLIDEDVAALYAYFMTRAPVHAAPRQRSPVSLQYPLHAGRLASDEWRLSIC